MKIVKFLLVAKFIFGIAIPYVYGLQDVDSIGAWNGKMEIPNFGPYEITLVLEKTNSKYKGTVSDDMDHIAEGKEFLKVKTNGNILSCTFDLADGSTVCLSLSLSKPMAIQ